MWMRRSAQSTGGALKALQAGAQALGARYFAVAESFPVRGMACKFLVYLDDAKMVILKYTELTAIALRVINRRSL